MNTSSSRRLAAILAADVAGYSRLIGEDEEGTIAALRDVRHKVVEPVISGYGGRIANTAGDSFVIEFRSAVDAVRAAIDIQSAMQSGDVDARIHLRIGLNVGDIVSNGDDILGDGVNVAARLEALAEPGGIVASQAVVSYARNNVKAGFAAMGAQQVKNIAEPVQAYQIVPEGVSVAPRPPARRKRVWPVLAGIAVICGAAAVYLFQPATDGASLAEAERLAFPLPDRPSIAVLPFAEGSGTPEDATLADGVTEDLITDLSRISNLFVIAGNTSFTYRDQDITLARFAEELGVRYVADGSVRRSGETLRITIRLTDTTTGEMIWANRYDSGLSELFAVQNQFSLAIADALDLSLNDAERVEIETPETKELAAREAFQKGWELYARFNESDNLAAIPHFRQALALDPEYGRAWAALALSHLRPAIYHHWNAFFESANGLHLTEFYKVYSEARKYPTSLTHVVHATASLTRPDAFGFGDGSRGVEIARSEAGRAIALQPSDPEAHLVMGWALIAADKPDEALSFIEAAMRLDPKHPSHYVLFQAAAYFAMDDLDRATEVLLEEIERNPEARELKPAAASFLALNGDLPEARAMVEQWQWGKPDRALAGNVQSYFFIVRWLGEMSNLNGRMKDGLQLAALPPSTTVASLRADLLRGDADKQRDAAKMLALFGADAAPAVPELTVALESSSTFVRKEAAITLGRIGAAAAPALPALEAASGNGLAGRFALRAIEDIRAAMAE